MVNAGLLPFTVVDDHVAQIWTKVFKSIRVHNDGATAVAFAVIVADRLSTQRDKNAAVNAEINQISRAASGI
jgi:hypothetical protein